MKRISSLDYNPFVYEMRANPYAVYAKIREQGAVVWSERYHFWRILGYKEAQEIFRSPHVSADISGIFRAGIYPASAQQSAEPLIEFFNSWLLFADPPYQAFLKKILSPFFSPAAVMTLQQTITSLVTECLDRTASEIDVLGEIAKPLTYQVILAVLGLPRSELECSQRTTTALSHFLDGVLRTPFIIQQANNALSEQQQMFLRYFAREVCEGNGVVQELQKVVQQKELSEQNFWRLLSMLLGTGAETSANLIANSLLALLRHPQQLELLRSNIAIFPFAVQELLRFDSPIQSAFRTATHDFLLDGQSIKQGEHIQIVFAAINRDVSIFSKPEVLDLTRHPNAHLAFGYGPHFCLGRFLAQMTVEICLKLMLQRFSNIELLSQKLDWEAGLMWRSLKRLWIKVS